IATIVDDHEVFIRDITQVHRGGGVVFARPVPCVVAWRKQLRLVCKPSGDVLGVFDRKVAKGFFKPQRQFKDRTFQMLGENAQIVRIDEGMLGRLVKEKLRMTHDVLIDGGVGGDQYNESPLLSTTGASGLLPG